MTHSPADVIRRLLIQLGLGSDPPAAPWPVYAGKEPGVPDNVITVRTTEGTDDGRDMISGEVWGHPGFQVRVRASDYVTGRTKADAIGDALATGVYQTVVAIGASRYFVHAVTHIGDVIDLGAETPSSQREVFTLNATCVVREL